MREQDPRVPADVEQYLIELFARAGQLGGSIGGGVGAGGAGALGGGRGGAKGGARGAMRLRTVVEDRGTVAPLTRDEALQKLTSAFPKLIPLPTADAAVRVAIPLGLTGLQQVVVDILVPASSDGQQLPLVRTYCKEGLLSRKPAARIADQVANALQNQ
ncbi:hypothetical protein Back2_28660 [Nocardioides baekrokdamisoli]|uniref:Uncharacterized protein n=1 Tax=Nocardioides baekrokdamisoli TaxID=1804624 RepID=A0A3G9J6D5_9ACTN|nr:hypothetical protein [Nocardioides baekrokdamisoli]BBH18579.1 hypothetical protein Back2_28660 [Nocardioides baekrokdamisoli]